MKKIFSLLALALFVTTNAHAGVAVYKNYYAEIHATPSSVGEVYLEPARDEDNAYIRDMSEDYGESAFIQITLERNGNEKETNSITSGQDVYMVKAYAECAEEYELVCYSNKIKEDGVYGPGDCFAVFNQYEDKDDERVASFNVTGFGDIININNPDHKREDGTSANDTPSRDEALASGQWDETPDQVIYAIFRKKGDELPKFDPTLIDTTPKVEDKSTNVENMENAVYIASTTVNQGATVNLAVKMKSSKPITAVEFTVEMPSEVATLGTPTLSTERTSEARTDYFAVMENNDNVKVVAFSHNNYEFSGEDGVIVNVPITVSQEVELAEYKYEMKVTNVVLSTVDGEAVKCGDVMSYVHVVDPQGISTVSDNIKNGKIYRVDGIEVKNADKPGLYIQNGKTVLVK